MFDPSIIVPIADTQREAALARFADGPPVLSLTPAAGDLDALANTLPAFDDMVAPEDRQEALTAVFKHQALSAWRQDNDRQTGSHLLTQSIVVRRPTVLPSPWPESDSGGFEILSVV